jgi:hypothetical protein
MAAGGTNGKDVDFCLGYIRFNSIFDLTFRPVS